MNQISEHADRGSEAAAESLAASVVVRRKPFWRPVLRPGSGRRLAAELYPQAAYTAALTFAAGLADPAYETLIRRIDQSPFHQDTQATPFFNGHAAFTAMLNAIRSARSEILLEAYVLRDDQTGRDFLHALKAAVDRGVEVRVLADAFGSSRTHGDFWSLLQRSGTRLRLFRRPRYAPLSLFPVLDHRKLLIVDRHIAFTGGMNIADEYRDGRPGAAAWRDTHVMLRGGVVWELAIIFAENWWASGGDRMISEGLSPKAGPGTRTLVLDTHPGRGHDEVFAAYAATMGAARESMWITNAYFAPGRRMVQLLKDTATRGVDVRLMLPGFCDIPIIRTATQGYYKELLLAGIRIFEYQASVLHAKTLVADTQVAMIGSSNFDFRSFHFNAECNVLMHDAVMAQRLEAAFIDDMAHAKEVSFATLRAQSWVRRLLSWMARKVAVFM